MPRLETLDLWPQILEKKDKMSVAELAKTFDVPIAELVKALKRTGSARTAAVAAPAPSEGQSDPELTSSPSAPQDGETENLTPAPKAAKASKAGRKRAKAKAGRPKKKASRARKEPATTEGRRKVPRGEASPRSKAGLVKPYEDLLGSVSDAEVAEKAGVSVLTIANYRRRHTIPAYDRWIATGKARPDRDTKPDNRARRSGQDRIDVHRSQVGILPDRVIAELAQVSLGTVRNYRRRMGIAGLGTDGSEHEAPRRGAPAEIPASIMNFVPMVIPPRGEPLPLKGRAIMPVPPARVRPPVTKVEVAAVASTGPVPKFPRKTEPGGIWAWLITVETGVDHAVMATDANDALSVAAGLGLTPIIGLKRMAPMAGR